MSARPPAHLPDCTVLILSCDAYADLWEPATYLLRRYWPDCPFEVRIASQTLAGLEGGFPTVQAGPGPASWSRDLERVLQQIGTEFVFVLLDDIFVRSRVDSARFLRLVEWMRVQGGDYLRLVPFAPGRAGSTVCPGVGKADPEERYWLTLQPSIWRRRFLLDLIEGREETAWAFENQVRGRVPVGRGIYAVTGPMFPTLGLMSHHVVQRGRWLPMERWLFDLVTPGLVHSPRGNVRWTDALICLATKYLLSMGYTLGPAEGRRFKAGLAALGKIILPKSFHERMGFRRE